MDNLSHSYMSHLGVHDADYRTILGFCHHLIASDISNTIGMNCVSRTYTPLCPLTASVSPEITLFGSVYENLVPTSESNIDVQINRLGKYPCNFIVIEAPVTRKKSFLRRAVHCIKSMFSSFESSDSPFENQVDKISSNNENTCASLSELPIDINNSIKLDLRYLKKKHSITMTATTTATTYYAKSNNDCASELNFSTSMVVNNKLCIIFNNHFKKIHENECHSNYTNPKNPIHTNPKNSLRTAGSESDYPCSLKLIIEQKQMGMLLQHSPPQGVTPKNFIGVSNTNILYVPNQPQITDQNLYNRSLSLPIQNSTTSSGNVHQSINNSPLRIFQFSPSPSSSHHNNISTRETPYFFPFSNQSPISSIPKVDISSNETALVENSNSNSQRLFFHSNISTPPHEPFSVEGMHYSNKNNEFKQFPGLLKENNSLDELAFGKSENFIMSTSNTKENSNSSSSKSDGSKTVYKTMLTNLVDVIIVDAVQNSIDEPSFFIEEGNNNMNNFMVVPKQNKNDDFLLPHQQAVTDFSLMVIQQIHHQQQQKILSGNSAQNASDINECPPPNTFNRNDHVTSQLASLAQTQSQQKIFDMTDDTFRMTRASSTHVGGSSQQAMISNEISARDSSLNGNNQVSPQRSSALNFPPTLKSSSSHNHSRWSNGACFSSSMASPLPIFGSPSLSESKKFQSSSRTDGPSSRLIYALRHCAFSNKNGIIISQHHNPSSSSSHKSVSHCFSNRKQMKSSPTLNIISDKNTTTSSESNHDVVLIESHHVSHSSTPSHLSSSSNNNTSNKRMNDYTFNNSSTPLCRTAIDSQNIQTVRLNLLKCLK